MLRLTIIGFGNQARAWCQNLKDSDYPFRVALRPNSPAFKQCEELGYRVIDLDSDEMSEDEIFALLVPDQAHKEILQKLAIKLKPSSIILYNHGFSLAQDEFQIKFSHLNHVLFAVKSIGKEIRTQYLNNGRLGAVYSLEYFKGDEKKFLTDLMKLSASLGINLGPYKTTFLHETQADLFSEQGLLCTLIPYAASEIFTEMTSQGIEPELAYLECWEELKLITSAMVEMGPEKFFQMISPNALIGSEKGFEKLFTNDFRQNLKNLFSDIKNQQFNSELALTSTDEIRERIQKRWSSTSLARTYKTLNPSGLP